MKKKKQIKKQKEEFQEDNEPCTDLEFEEALELLGSEVREIGENRFIVIYWVDGVKKEMGLGAESYSDALFEAWNIVRR